MDVDFWAARVHRHIPSVQSARLGNSGKLCSILSKVNFLNSVSSSEYLFSGFSDCFWVGFFNRFMNWMLMLFLILSQQSIVFPSISFFLVLFLYITDLFSSSKIWEFFPQQ